LSTSLIQSSPLERIAAVLEKGEERTAFLREAVEREIGGRRKAQAGAKTHMKISLARESR